MEKSVIFFTKGDGVRFPIVKAFNVPENIKLPKNITTIKTSNISLSLSCTENGDYKLIGDFIEDGGVTYLKVAMVMQVPNMEDAISQHESTIV